MAEIKMLFPPEDNQRESLAMRETSLWAQAEVAMWQTSICRVEAPLKVETHRDVAGRAVAGRVVAERAVALE